MQINHPAPFVLIAQPRSGSTFLVDLITNQSNGYCENELFNPHSIVFINAKKNQASDQLTHSKKKKARQKKLEQLLLRNADPVSFIESYYNDFNQSSHKALGFNYMLGHNAKLLDYFLEHPKIKIIYLKRDNKLAQYASWRKALKSGQWATRSLKAANKNASKKVFFRKEDFRSTMSSFSFYDLSFSSLLESKPSEHILKLSYLDILRGNAEEKIFTFLGLQPQRKKNNRPIIRLGNSDIAERFSNHHQVREYCRNENLSHWLNEI